MKLAIATILVGTAAAFAPSPEARAPTSLNMDRRAAAGQIATGAAVLAGLPQLALADGARSAATVSRAKGIYGQRIAALESAVASGDFGAVAAEKNAFILFNSGALGKDQKPTAVKQTNDIFAAIRAKDASALKSAYGAYKSSTGIELVKVDDVMSGQGYSNDYDFKTRTPAG